MAALMDTETLLKRPLYVYDLPRDILGTLQIKAEDIEFSTGTSTPDIASAEVPRPVSPVAEGDNDENKTTVSCSLCGLTFKSYQEQRIHARSDMHSYNLKLKLRGLKPINETDFEQVMGELDESISGSDTSESESESEAEDTGKGHNSETMLSALLKKQARLEETEDVSFGKKRKRGAGKPPLLWFKTPLLPSNTSLGIYRAIFTNGELQESGDIIQVLHTKQLVAAPQVPVQDPEGGVRLPQARSTPHVFMCMIGGGHFAAMIVSLAPKYAKKQGGDERQAAVLAHKTFHRYTTRRKQGGAQSANDNAKGNAHSAGSSLRRYNEVALETEIRALLLEWKDLVNSSQLIFVRATGTTNRRTLFGPYEGQVLRQDDPRNRGFPFSTRRATQAELMRSFVELTRVKVSEVDEVAVAAAQAKALKEAEAQKQAVASKAKAAESKAQSCVSPEDEAALLHTSQIEALVRRSKVPALLSYFTTNALSSNFSLFPPDTQTHHHAPTTLHLAASTNSPALVTALLVKAGADPTIASREGKTAFDIAGDRATRDAFRLARSELGEGKWQWNDAHVPEPLTKAEIDERSEREREERNKEEETRRKAEIERIREEEKRKKEDRKKAVDERRDKTMGKGKKVGAPLVTAEERREEEARGMTPEMKMRLEREKRARAAEERMKSIQRGAGGSGGAA